MEHKLILGGAEYLPFARSCITKLKATGLAYVNQSYEVGGVSIKVRIEPGHEYIRLEGGVINAITEWRGGIYRTWRQPSPVNVVEGTNVVTNPEPVGSDPARESRYSRTSATVYALRPVITLPWVYIPPVYDPPIQEVRHLTLLSPDGQYAAQVQNGEITFLGPPDKPADGQDQADPVVLAVVDVKAAMEAPLIPGIGVVLKPTASCGRITPVLLCGTINALAVSTGRHLNETTLCWIDALGVKQQRYFSDSEILHITPVSSLGQWVYPDSYPYTELPIGYVDWPASMPPTGGTARGGFKRDPRDIDAWVQYGTPLPQSGFILHDQLEDPRRIAGGVWGAIVTDSTTSYIVDRVQHVESSGGHPAYDLTFAARGPISYSVSLDAVGHCPEIKWETVSCVVGSHNTVYALVETHVMTTAIPNVHTYEYTFTAKLRLHTYGPAGDTVVDIESQDWTAMVSYGRPGSADTFGTHTNNPMYRLEGAIILSSMKGKPHVEILVTVSKHPVTEDKGTILRTGLYRRKKDTDPFVKTELLRRSLNASQVYMTQVEFVSGTGLAREWYPRAGISQGKLTYFLGGHILRRVPPVVVDGIETVPEKFTGARPTVGATTEVFIYGSSKIVGRGVVSLDRVEGGVRRMNVKDAITVNTTVTNGTLTGADVDARLGFKEQNP